MLQLMVTLLLSRVLVPAATLGYLLGQEQLGLNNRHYTLVNTSMAITLDVLLIYLVTLLLLVPTGIQIMMGDPAPPLYFKDRVQLGRKRQH